MEGNDVAIANEEAPEQIRRRRSYYIIAAIVFILWILSDSSINDVWSNGPKSEDETTHMQNFPNTTLVMQTTAIPFVQLKNTLASVLWEAIDAFVNSTYAPNITTTYFGVSLICDFRCIVLANAFTVLVHDTTFPRHPASHHLYLFIIVHPCLRNK
jgi:hypothetical protein